MRQRLLALIWSAVVVALVGCTGAAAAPEPRPAPTEQRGPTLPPTVRPTTLPTATRVPPTATLTSTPLPTETAAPTMTPTETQTPLPKQEPTALPTATYPPPPPWVEVPILMYHYVSDLPPDADVYRRDLTVAPTRFEEHLRYLVQQGYETVTLADIYARLTTGRPLPDRPIVLTFDDGYRDAYTTVTPLLQEYGFVGEFFVLATPAHYEAKHYVTWRDVAEMARAGMSVQAHGRDHVDLTNRDYDFLVYQVLGAKEAVEAHTGAPVRFFCYPSGRHDADTEAVVASAGYLGAVTTVWGNRLSLENRYIWPRIRVKGAWSMAQYAAVLESLPQSN